MENQQYEQTTENNAVEEVQQAAVDGIEGVAAKVQQFFGETAEEVQETIEEQVEEVMEPVEEEPVEEIDPNICQKCGFELGDDQNFCPKCGTQKGAAAKLVCSKCGTELIPGQQFCTKCGTPAAAVKAENPILAKLKGLSKKTKIIAAAAVAGVIILAAVLSSIVGNSGKDFSKMYAEYGTKRWCTIASDGSWMELDTNPNNTDSDEYYDWDTMSAASDAVKRINTELGFPSSLMNKMNTTTWSMGRQEEETDKYRVSWTYHPDKGLEVLYEVK